MHLCSHLRKPLHVRMAHKQTNVNISQPHFVLSNKTHGDVTRRRKQTIVFQKRLGGRVLWVFVSNTTTSATKNVIVELGRSLQGRKPSYILHEKVHDVLTKFTEIRIPPKLPCLPNDDENTRFRLLSTATGWRRTGWWPWAFSMSSRTSWRST